MEHAGPGSHFQETDILEPHALMAYIPDKFLEAQVGVSFIMRNIGEGDHPLRMALRDPAGPFIGYAGLVLGT